ncbi:MAG: dipeptide ABC transporter permease DppC, partial [Mesorhizobium sp.]
MTQTEIAPMAAGSPDRLTGLKTFWHYFSVNRGA